MQDYIQYIVVSGAALMALTLVAVAIGIVSYTYYKGVDIMSIVRTRMVRKRNQCFNRCHVGPGSSCSNCLVYGKCVDIIRDEVKHEIDTAIAQRENCPDD
jgi:hypothetical protein